MRFKIKHYYKHKDFKDLFIQIITHEAPGRFTIAYFTLGYGPKNPTFLGFSRAYKINKGEDWIEFYPEGNNK